MEPIIHFNSTSLVKPSSSYPANGSLLPRRIDLTPFDLQLLPAGYIQRGLLFNKPTPKQLEELTGNSVINHLRDSLSRTLGIFTPLAGRLAITEHRDDNTRSFYVDCNGDGAQFIDAAAPGVTVAQILEPYVPEVVYSLLPMEGVRNFEGVSKPLLVVQVTELEDGVFVGVAVNHAIADGVAFWHFMNTWSEISRSPILSAGPHHHQELLSQPVPVFGQWFLDGIERPIRIPADSLYQRTTGTSNSAPWQVRIFHFTKESIAALKAQANAESNSIGGNSSVSISSLQAILALFWRSITRSKRLEAHLEKTLCNVTMNVRQRLRPQLPDKYFGNAIIIESATATASELLEHGLGWAAMQINKMIALQTDEEIKKKLKALVDRPPQALKLVQPARSNITRLIFGSSPWFDVYGNDFGWGKPITVRSGRGKALDGKIISFPGAGEHGSVDIHACLKPEILQALENDTEFMEAISTL
ncbi:hypothetical protein Tsubulata_046551 [Turnera subulata]|uniref:Uncharacterized protein n=1 Tax=Turnera subulata TaxID=218843 RepID=A0A9Q0F7N2_9ROSI|nr:hypothetical protein Tsubulata_046551 [Turnera subulata]